MHLLFRQWRSFSNVACKTAASRIAVTLAAAAFTFLPCLHAQTSEGTITGTITDSTGAAVEGATVTAVSGDTGEKRIAKTNSSGGYRIESVTPGTFTVTADASGFKTVKVERVRVSASTTSSVNEMLGVGSNNETIEVTSDQDLLQTESGAISGNIGAVAVENLPISGLNPYFLALTLPGVQQTNTQTAFGNGVTFSVNGARSRANNFLIEGSDNNDAGIHGQGMQPENLDAIEQVVVLTNASEAEFGGGGGSVNNLIFKNGSNRFHGAAWDRISNSTLDAADKSNFYSGQTKSKYRENIFGYDIGGFIKRDKLFFFNSLQFDHYRSSSQSTLTVPTASGIATLQSLQPNPRIATLLQALGSFQGVDDLSAVQFACSPITEATPATAFCPASSVAVGPGYRYIPNDSNSPELDNKVEWLPSSKDTVIFRFIRTHYEAPYDLGNFGNQLPGFDTTENGVTYNAGINETHIFSNNLLNELRLSYGRIGFNFDFQPATYANPLGTAPTTSIDGINYFGAPSGDPQSRQHNTYQIQDALSWTIHGRHAVKVGFDVSDIRVRDGVPFNYYGSIDYATTKGYSGIANYIDDFGGTNGSVAYNFGSPIARPQMYNQAYYIQDAWKASENLTVELGFRYQFQGTPFNVEPYPTFDPTNAACTNPAPSGTSAEFCKINQKADWSQYGPRFGFAYSPNFLQKKTVLRGGFGMFYDGLFTNIVDNTQSSAPNVAAPEIVSTTAAGVRGLGNFSSYLNPSLYSQQAALGDVIESMTPNIKSPRTLQWNLNIQQDFGNGFIAQMGYIGTRGEHLFGTTETNPFAEPYGDVRLFPNLGRVINRDNSADSIYHSAQVQIDRSFRHGFLMRAAYTWSKLEDDGAEIFTSGNASTYGMLQYPFSRKSIDYGLSPLDVRHRLVVSYVYAPPSWRAEGAAKIAAAIVNGFQISGIQQFSSGSPGNTEVGYDFNGDGISNDRPVLSNPHAPVASYAFDRAWYWGDGGTGLCDGPEVWYNIGCVPVTPDQVHYIVPALNVDSAGNTLFTSTMPVVQRDGFRTRGNQEADVSLQRSFHIHDLQHLDFRAEAFNVLNQGTTAIPNLTLTSIKPNPTYGNYGTTTFGDFAPTVSGHRNLRFYVKYAF